MERGPLDGSLTITTDFAPLCDSLVGDKEALPGGLCHQNCTGHHVPAAVRFHDDTCPHALYVHLPAIPCTRQRFVPRVGTIAHRTLRTCLTSRSAGSAPGLFCGRLLYSCVQLQSDHRLLLLCLSQVVHPDGGRGQRDDGIAQAYPFPTLVLRSPTPRFLTPALSR